MLTVKLVTMGENSSHVVYSTVSAFHLLIPESIPNLYNKKQTTTTTKQTRADEVEHFGATPTHTKQPARSVQWETGPRAVGRRCYLSFR